MILYYDVTILLQFTLLYYTIYLLHYIYSFISREILDIIRVSDWGGRLMIGSG